VQSLLLLCVKAFNAYLTPCPYIVYKMAEGLCLRLPVLGKFCSIKGYMTDIFFKNLFNGISLLIYTMCMYISLQYMEIKKNELDIVFSTTF